MHGEALQARMEGRVESVIDDAQVEDFGGSRPEEGIDSQTPGHSTLGLIELLLKRPSAVDELNREPSGQRELFPRFLLIGEVGYLLYGLIMVLLLNLAPASAHPQGPGLTMPRASWSDGAGLGLVLGYTLGILCAAGVCLPSFYFYSLLAGVRITWLQITSLVGKGTAANAVLLLGILPIYVAIVLGLIVFQAPAIALRWSFNFGLALPFLCGIWGLRSIYLGILDQSMNQPYQWACQRQCFLRRVTFSWAVVYAAVVPVMIYRLWEFFADLVRFA